MSGTCQKRLFSINRAVHSKTRNARPVSSNIDPTFRLCVYKVAGGIKCRRRFIGRRTERQEHAWSRVESRENLGGFYGHWLSSRVTAFSGKTPGLMRQVAEDQTVSCDTLAEMDEDILVLRSDNSVTVASLLASGKRSLAIGRKIRIGLDGPCAWLRPDGGGSFDLVRSINCAHSGHSGPTRCFVRGYLPSSPALTTDTHTAQAPFSRTFLPSLPPIPSRGLPDLESRSNSASFRRDFNIFPWNLARKRLAEGDSVRKGVDELGITNQKDRANILALVSELCIREDIPGGTQRTGIQRYYPQFKRTRRTHQYLIGM
ncbi:hypothetical protein Bbelb_086080 [Branchiostoma belcheri]|nr:hypothetical protein Bbelb_086080 [Branchiostoma belcheri]